MYKIIFVCHGNICRSPSAMFIARDLLSKKGITTCEVSSRALSDEEYLNDVYPPMKSTLLKHKVPLSFHQAKKITKKEYEDADLVLIMDRSNYQIISYYFDDLGKVKFLGGYIKEGFEIVDPWYNRDFERTYQEIETATKNLIEDLIVKKKI